jgi:hypothetical protein
MACFRILTSQASRSAWRPQARHDPHGATGDLRAQAAFATAKHGLRALAQSMARELGPMNIHVAHVIIDGAIDTAFIRDNFPARYAEKDQDGILSPEHIADAYWYLHSQPRDAWTFELDLRPGRERWCASTRKGAPEVVHDNRVEFFDFMSPTPTCRTQLPGLRAAGATLVYRPMLSVASSRPGNASLKLLAGASTCWRHGAVCPTLRRTHALTHRSIR